MKLLLSLSLLIAVAASPLKSIPNQLPLIQQESEQSEVDQRNAFILESIRNELESQAGNFDVQELKGDNLNILNTIRDILINEINKADYSDNIKVEQIAKNNGLEHINKELENNQNKALLDENPDEGKTVKNFLWTPENVLRSENILNNEDDSNKNTNLEQPDQYELKIAGFEPHIQDYKNDSNESSDSQSESDSGSIEKNENVNPTKKLFDNRYLRYPHGFFNQSSSRTVI